jgi:hypothetical protein
VRSRNRAFVGMTKEVSDDRGMAEVRRRDSLLRHFLSLGQAKLSTVAHPRERSTSSEYEGDPEGQATVLAASAAGATSSLASSATSGAAGRVRRRR